MVTYEDGPLESFPTRTWWEGGWRIWATWHEDGSKPSFMIDYLTFSLKTFKKNKQGIYVIDSPLTKDDLNWVEVKYNKSRLSRNQKNIIGKTQIPLRVFKLHFSVPKYFDISPY